MILCTEVATTIQPSECQNNPAYIHLGPMESSQAGVLVSGGCNQNPAYNTEAPIYEVIHLDADGSPHTIPGTHSINCSQNPAYTCIPLGVGVKEIGFQAYPTSSSDYSQNPAYGIHSNPN